MVMLDPATQPFTWKSKSPCGNTTPEGGATGGLAGSPVTGMKRGVGTKVHPALPVKLAVIVPVPVADGPENVVTVAGPAGVTGFDGAEGAPVPTPLVAVTVKV
jgi:hypothetical protein